MWGGSEADEIRAEIEARNTLQQFDLLSRYIKQYQSNKSQPFQITPELIKAFNQVALQDLRADGGVFRQEDVVIGGALHDPPAASTVPMLVQDLCDEVSARWKQDSISLENIDLAAYVLWRICWIHPFVDGNGRTARILAYLILCIGFGYELPGQPTMAELMAKNRRLYQDGLQAADLAFQKGETDISVLRDFVAELILQQLQSAIS